MFSLKVYGIYPYHEFVRQQGKNIFLIKDIPQSFSSDPSPQSSCPSHTTVFGRQAPVRKHLNLVVAGQSVTEK